MDSKDLDLVKIGQNGEFGRYIIAPAAEIVGEGFAASTVNEQYGSDTAVVFDEDTVFDVNYKPLEINGKSYNYIPYGDDDDMPGKIRRLIGDNMVTAQGMLTTRKSENSAFAIQYMNVTWSRRRT